MKNTKFTDEQMTFALRQAEAGTLVKEVCRKLSVSDQTLYRWQKTCAGTHVMYKTRVDNGTGFRVSVWINGLNFAMCDWISATPGSPWIRG